jgi:hypothetical protein
MMCLKKARQTWNVSKFVIDHNYEFFSPKSTSLLHGHRVVTPAQKNLMDTINESSVPQRKIMPVLSNEFDRDHIVGCVAKDVPNYLGSKRRNLLGQVMQK